MDIPLSKREISILLQISQPEVEVLWETEQLRRSLHPSWCDCSDLDASSDFDVLEYQLTRGDLSVSLTRFEASLWVANLAEVLEYEGANYDGAIGLAKALLDCSIFDELCDSSEHAIKVAYICAAAYLNIVRFCTNYVEKTNKSILPHFLNSVDIRAVDRSQ